MKDDWLLTFAGRRPAAGWFRFQRRHTWLGPACAAQEGHGRRIVREAAHDDAAEGSRWLELQIDPTSHAPFVGGITPALEIVLDEATAVSVQLGVAKVAMVVAAQPDSS